MHSDEPRLFTAFAGTRQFAKGALAAVALSAKAVIDDGSLEPILIFDDLTSEQIDLDFRSEALASYAASLISPSRSPGRPKLGVVAREVTLLPRHWEWLSQQPGGASVAIRKLVDAAKRINADSDEVRQSQDSAYKFMSAMAGNLPGFEEAIRALYARRQEQFDQLIESWPADIREHACKVAGKAFAKAKSDCPNN